ncbi:MAG: hypothetical protein MRZ79_17950 [Bacteroidia bacterium]|nr:hypothetical protein [Bacteroidia bacterium]
MKTYIKFLPVLFVAFFLFEGCDGGKVKELEQKNAALQSQKITQDSILNDFMTTFDEFEKNLETIKTKENLISMNSNGSEMRVSQKDKIVSDIQMINGLLDENRMMIDELNAKAEKFEGQASTYRRMVSSLKKQLKDRENQIVELKEQLATLDFKVEELNGKVTKLDEVNKSLVQLTSDQESQLSNQEGQINSQGETIDAQLTSLNTAFYVVGEVKELKTANVIGKGKRMVQNVDESSFTKIDIRNVREIPVSGKKVVLLTPHPEGSYIITDEDQDKKYDFIQITDPAKFWKTSKYLVVSVD